MGQNRAYEDRDAPARHLGGRDAERLRANVERSAALSSAPPAPPLLCSLQAGLDPRGVLALQRGAGNAAVARLIQAAPAGQRPGTQSALRSLQRYKVYPQPRVEHQWLRKGKLVDLNCGWYAQLGVVDYHYLKSIAPRLTDRQRRALEQGGHLSYAAGKRKLAHDVSWSFDPEGRDAQGQPYINTPPAAISQKLAKPTTPAEWKKALQDHGPLIVSKAWHYLLVVGVTPQAFYYRDSLTGTAMYHDFLIMNKLIGDVYFVELREVQKLFKAELKAALRLGRARRFAAIGDTSSA